MTACAEVLTRRSVSLTTHRAASLAAAHRTLTIGKSQHFCEDTTVNLLGRWFSISFTKQKYIR